MKLKILFLALILGLIAIPAKAQSNSNNNLNVLCSYTTGESYDTFYDIFKSKRGDNMEFIKFCYEDGLKYGYPIDKDYREYGGYVTTSAAKFNRLEALKFFLSKGHRLDDNRYTPTPLQFSAKNGNYEISKYLLDKGASPVKKDDMREYDAYDYAKQSGVQRVIELVKGAWNKWQGVSELRHKQYKKEVQNINMNDYEKFKLKFGLGNFSSDSFFSRA